MGLCVTIILICCYKLSPPNIETKSNLELLFHIGSQELIKKPRRIETLNTGDVSDVEMYVIIDSNRYVENRVGDKTI